MGCSLNHRIQRIYLQSPNNPSLKNNKPLKMKNINKHAYCTKQHKQMPSKILENVSQALPKDKNKMKDYNKEQCVKQSENRYAFRARPVPKNMFIKPTGLGKKIVLPNTVAKSPFFYSEKRLQKRKLQEIMQEEKENHLKNAKIEDEKFPVTPKLQQPKCTNIQSLSSDKRKLVLKKDIKKERPTMNKSTVFQDEFIPTFRSSMLSNISKNTYIEMPLSNSRSSRNLLKKPCLTTKNFTFKTQPASVFGNKPFLPEKAPTKKLEFKEFKFCTGKRATDRLELKKEKELLGHKRNSLQRKVNLAKKSVVMKQFSTLKNNHLSNIIKNSKCCTVAISPKFETEKRLRCRKSKYYGLV